jgi:hypothetical protein
MRTCSKNDLLINIYVLYVLAVTVSTDFNFNIYRSGTYRPPGALISFLAPLFIYVRRGGMPTADNGGHVVVSSIKTESLLQVQRL